jgi:hypothetical protein
MNLKRKITVEQEEELVRVFVEHGRKIAGELAEQYGVHRNYPLNAAAKRGIKRPRWRKGNRYVDAKVDHSVNTFKDPRWERAKAIGAVVA